MMKARPLLQNFSALGLGCLLLGALSGPALADSDEGPVPESSEPLLRPIKVVSTSGNVQNAEALVEGHGGYATLTMVQGGAVPIIILDYGRVVGGIPVFEVSAVSGAPKLQAIYSESQPYLLPDGDAASPGEVENPAAAQPEVSFVGNAGAGDLARLDTYFLSRTGLIVNRLIQGGERFEALTLSVPGSVSLHLVGIRSKTFHPPHTANRGSFFCSDAALNEIWALGAHSVRLNQVPTRSLPPTWTPTPEGVVTPGNEFCVYQGGIPWKNYTASFQVQVLSNEAAWLLRAKSSDGLHFVLAADNDALGIGKLNTLRAYSQFFKVPVGEAALPFDLKPGSWHTVKTVVIGTKASVYLDGQSQPVLSFDFSGVQGFAGAISAGSVGFGNQQGAEAQFRNLSVVSADGQTLYASALTNTDVLDDFAAGVNRLPTIMDGPKRDRYVWSGDIGISGLSILYDSGAGEYIAGSLRLHGDYATPSGEAAGFLPPQLIPRVKPSDNNFSGYTFTTDYSIYFVTSLYNYYLYTGDRGFVTEEWPAVEKEMSYLAGLVDPTHHVIAGGFGPAKDTASNAHYYAALVEAAKLANALDKADEAATFNAQAALLKAAINAYLFNPSTGLYDLSDAQRGVADQLGNAKALLYGVAPPQAVSLAAILQKLREALYQSAPLGPVPVQQSSGSAQVGPFPSGFELLARFETGDTAGALALIRNEWGLMRKSSPYYSGGTWEYVALDGTPGLGEGTSLAHGWASGPTAGLSKYVLGVRPVEPGYKTWLIEPQTGDLSWAEGTVPTPYGPIEVKWRKTSKGLSLEIDVPAGTSGTVGVPANVPSSSLTDNGQPVQEAKNRVAANASESVSGARPGYTYLEDLGPGAHVIQARGGEK